MVDWYPHEWADSAPWSPPTRLFDGFPVAEPQFSETSSPPFFNLAPCDAPIASEAAAKAYRAKRSFQAQYPTYPTHPDHAQEAPSFIQDMRHLKAQLACTHAIFLVQRHIRRDTQDRQRAREEVETRFHNAMYPLRTNAYLSAWLDVPARTLSNEEEPQSTTAGGSGNNTGEWDGGAGWGDGRWGSGWGDVSGWVNTVPRLGCSQYRPLCHGRRNMGRTFRMPRTLHRRPKMTRLLWARRVYAYVSKF
ncbi:hypothetical protein B0H17DRAFT_1129464 [Mycena rosella]|uniref:Uncharacterized protein n=1 Tax=Mycena rosella TaxID=1033263 RepID=A0AAD7DSU8_MYCRO|nr:hypothetical protein B0H17DRAFT_1129464 [Mycena rosella]